MDFDALSQMALNDGDALITQNVVVDEPHVLAVNKDQREIDAEKIEKYLTQVLGFGAVNITERIDGAIAFEIAGETVAIYYPEEGRVAIAGIGDLSIYKVSEELEGAEERKKNHLVSKDKPGEDNQVCESEDIPPIFASNSESCDLDNQSCMPPPDAYVCMNDQPPPPPKPDDNTSNNKAAEKFAENAPNTANKPADTNKPADANNAAQINNASDDNKVTGTDSGADSHVVLKDADPSSQNSGAAGRMEVAEKQGAGGSQEVCSLKTDPVTTSTNSENTVFQSSVSTVDQSQNSSAALCMNMKNESVVADKCEVQNGGFPRSHEGSMIIGSNDASFAGALLAYDKNSGVYGVSQIVSVNDLTCSTSNGGEVSVFVSDGRIEIVKSDLSSGNGFEIDNTNPAANYSSNIFCASDGGGSGNIVTIKLSDGSAVAVGLTPAEIANIQAAGGVMGFLFVAPSNSNGGGVEIKLAKSNLDTVLPPTRGQRGDENPNQDGQNQQNQQEKWVAYAADEGVTANG